MFLFNSYFAIKIIDFIVETNPIMKKLYLWCVSDCHGNLLNVMNNHK